MKKFLLVVLFLSVNSSVFANNSLWHTYSAKFFQGAPESDRERLVSGEEFEGVLEAIVVDNIDRTHERYFVLKTRDGRYVNLPPSGVEEYELKDFSREHPTRVRMQVKRVQRASKSGLVFLGGYHF